MLDCIGGVYYVGTLTAKRFASAKNPPACEYYFEGYQKYCSHARLVQCGSKKGASQNRVAISEISRG